jgi:hypothetical protein
VAAFDPSEPDPVPEFEFDQSPPDEFHFDADPTRVPSLADPVNGFLGRELRRRAVPDASRVGADA